MYDFKDLYNKHKHYTERLDRLRVKQFKVEQHLEAHPQDYTAVIDNMKLKSEIYREEKKIQQVLMMMEVVFE